MPVLVKQCPRTASQKILGDSSLRGGMSQSLLLKCHAPCGRSFPVLQRGVLATGAEVIFIDHETVRWQNGTFSPVVKFDVKWQVLGQIVLCENQK